MISSRNPMLRNITASKFSSNGMWGSIRPQLLLCVNVPARKKGSKASWSPTSRKANGMPKSDIVQSPQKYSQIYDNITALIEKGDKTILWQYVDSNWSNLTVEHINKLLFQTTKHSIQVPSHYLLKIANILESTNEHISGKKIAGIIYSFKNTKYEMEDIEMNILISVLADKLQDSKTVFNAKQFGMILYGLQGMSAQYEEVRNLLRVLSLKIRCSSFEFKAQSIGMALYGLQGMSSEFEEVRLLLKSLHEKMGSDMTLTLDGQAAGNSLYGLQQMSYEHVEVQDILKTLSSYINVYRMTSGRSVGM
eukprot:gene9783-20346_t